MVAEVFLLRSGKPTDSEGIRKEIARNGHMLQVHASVVHRHGALTGFVVLLTDVTQERYAVSDSQISQATSGAVSHAFSPTKPSWV